MSTNVHSPVGASGYYRWKRKACSGSVRMSRGLENKTTEYAAEGSVAHGIGEAVLRGERTLQSFLGEVIEHDGHLIGVTKDMLDSVAVYVDYVQGLVEEGGELHVERHFKLADIHPLAAGTADATVIFRKKRRIVVADYKHGAGIEVEVEDNEQAMYYALGALLEFKVPVDEVELVIVQPRYERGEPVKRWVFPAVNLLEFAADLADDAAATDDPEAPLNPGEWCRFCPAAGLPCPALEEKRKLAVKTEFSSLLPYDPKRLAAALKEVPVVEAWLKAVREFAYVEAMAGRGEAFEHKVVPKVPRRHWKDEKAAKNRLVLELEIDVTSMYDEPSFKSPAQIEKLIKGKAGKELRDLVEELTVKVSSGFTLAPLEDSRTAVARDAQSEFGALPSEQ